MPTVRLSIHLDSYLSIYTLPSSLVTSDENLCLEDDADRPPGHTYARRLHEAGYRGLTVMHSAFALDELAEVNIELLICRYVYIYFFVWCVRVRVCMPMCV